MASVGLAQNFAALRALVTEGIQRGHMELHAKNFTLQAGVPSEKIQEALQHMKKEKQVNL
jgi:hydroxymethylglutaryl-CoA reductase